MRLPRRLQVAITAGLSLCLVSAVFQPFQSASAVGSDTIKTGVYRGAGGWGAEKIPAYESFIGHKVDYALEFQATDTWPNQEWPEWQSSAWAGRTVILGATGIFPGGWDRNGGSVGWAQAARGDYDAHWLRLGQRLVATGQSRAILRGAHEFNGGWFPHRVHPEEANDFINSWRRWVTIMRSVPGQSFTFDWNPTIGTEWPLYKPEIAYPGDAYVDRIALDVYDGWYKQGWKPGGAQPTAAQRDAVWHEIMHGERGMLFWKNFAIAHNKRMSLPEWGIRLWDESDGLIHGGGDNASFVRRMAAVIKDPSWRMDYHAFWEDPTGGVLDPDNARRIPVPQARAAYLAEFGPGSTSTRPPVTTTPPTTKPPIAPAPTPTSVPGPAPAPAPAPVAGVCRTVSAQELPLPFSPWSDRSWQSELTGRTVNGHVFAWVPDAGVASVSFKVDDRPERIDTEAPFDMVAGNVWWAYPLNTSTMTKGAHSVKVTAKQRSGGCITRTAGFTIR